MRTLNLYEKCYDLVKQIPPGMVSTYGLIAEALGDKIAARAVGKMLGENQRSFLRKDVPEEEKVPCHRVVKSDGAIGGFTSEGGVSDKIALLCAEGVKIVDGIVQDFETRVFTDFKTDYPLARIRKEQEMLSREILIADDYKLTDVGIVDVAYYGRKAFCALVVLEAYGEKKGVFRAVCDVMFPYIPTYLAYRELPPIFNVLDIYRPSILIIDGNGILHPRGMGIASHVGVLAEIPAIGAAKSLLTGELRDDKILLDGKHVGYVVEKYFVSPGHRVSIESARELVKRFHTYIREAHREAGRMKSTSDF